MTYSVSLSVYEGPFDLLFSLIEKNKIDIYDIPISVIADQYMERLFEMTRMDLDIAGEFLVMASTLLHIKSRLLLPKVKRGEDGVDGDGDNEGEDVADPREELVISMIEYGRYKAFAQVLRESFDVWGRALYRPGGLFDAAAAGGAAADSVDDIDMDILAQTYKRLVESNMRKTADDVQERVGRIIRKDRAPVADKIREIVRRLASRSGFLFQKVFGTGAGKTSRRDMVAGFSAILELSRQNVVKIRQKRLFGPIYVSRTSRTAGETAETIDERR